MSYETKDLVTRYKASGLTQKKFCKKNSLPHSTLQYHLQRFKEPLPQPKIALPGFIPVSMPKAPGATSSIVIIRGNYSPAQIAEMIKGTLE